MWPYLLSKFLRNIINFLLSENAVSPMNGKVQGPFGSPRFFMKKKVTRITATLVRNKMYDRTVSIVVTKYFDFKNRVLNFFFFFFTSFQYRIALLLNLRDNNRGFMNHQSVFRLRKPRCNTRSLFTKQQVWCPEYGTLRRAYYGYTIFYAISFKILVPK